MLLGLRQPRGWSVKVYTYVPQARRTTESLFVAVFPCLTSRVTTHEHSHRMANRRQAKWHKANLEFLGAGQHLLIYASGCNLGTSCRRVLPNLAFHLIGKYHTSSRMRPGSFRNQCQYFVTFSQRSGSAWSAWPRSPGWSVLCSQAWYVLTRMHVPLLGSWDRACFVAKDGRRKTERRLTRRRKRQVPTEGGPKSAD